MCNVNSAWMKEKKKPKKKKPTIKCILAIWRRYREPIRHQKFIYGKF